MVETGSEGLPDGLEAPRRPDPSLPPRVCEHPGCDMATEVAWEFTVRTSGGVAGGARMCCVVGHWYTWLGPDVEDPFTEEVLPPDLWDRD